jgi:hypothetical protein
MKPHHVIIFMFFMLSFILHSSFNVCLFVSIQFRDKIVLIVIYKSLNV